MNREDPPWYFNEKCLIDWTRVQSITFSLNATIYSPPNLLGGLCKVYVTFLLLGLWGTGIPPLIIIKLCQLCGAI